MTKPVQLAAALAVGCLWATAGGAAVPSHSGDLDAGRTVAVNVCAWCHVVAKNQPFGPALQPPAPAFAAIAERPGTTAQSLRNFITSTHHDMVKLREMPNPELSDEQVNDVVSYLLTQQHPGAGSHPESAKDSNAVSHPH